MEAKDLPYGELLEVTQEELEGMQYLLDVSMNKDWDDFDPVSTLSFGVDEPIQSRDTDSVAGKCLLRLTKFKCLPLTSPDTYGHKAHQPRDIPDSFFDSMPVNHDLQGPVLNSLHLKYDSHDPVLGPATLEFLETYHATAITPVSTSSDITEMEACIYPLDALISLENVNLGPLVQDANHVIDLTSPAKSASCAVEVDTKNQDASTTPTSITPTISDITMESNSPKSSVTSVNTTVEASEAAKQKRGVQPGQAQKKETSKSTPRKDRSKTHEPSAIRSNNQTSPTEPTLRTLAPAPTMEATVKIPKKSQKTVSPASTAPIPTSITPQKAISVASTGIEYKTPCKPQKQAVAPIMTPLSSVAATPIQTTISESASISQSGYAASGKTVMPAVLPPTPKSLPLSKDHASSIHTQSVPTSQYDPNIHKLQTAYEAKQKQAKIEHQNKSCVQKQPSQQSQSNKQRLVRIQKDEQLKRLQEKLNTQAKKLNMEGNHLSRKREALKKHPDDFTIQERTILSEQWKLFRENCQKHKTEKNKFIQLQGHSGVQQEDQAGSKLEVTPQFQGATQTQAAASFKVAPQQQARPPQFQVSLSKDSFQHQTIQRQATPSQATQRKAIQHQAISQYQAPSPFQALPQYQAVPEFQVSTESRSQSLQQSRAPVPARPCQLLNYVSPSTSHTQSISSCSSAAQQKRGFSDMNSPMTNDKLATNPVGHDQWSVGSSVDFTDLNGPPIKKFKWALK